MQNFEMWYFLSIVSNQVFGKLFWKCAKLNFWKLKKKLENKTYLWETWNYTNGNVFYWDSETENTSFKMCDKGRGQWGEKRRRAEPTEKFDGSLWLAGKRNNSKTKWLRNWQELVRKLTHAQLEHTRCHRLPTGGTNKHVHRSISHTQQSHTHHQGMCIYIQGKL